MGALVDYWYYTGDTRWVNTTQEGLLFQTGPNNDYMPPNQTMTEGNDDQGFWGLAAMSAAEYNFPNPPSDKPQWLALAQAVFNTQAPRWDTEYCGGGLRWQIFTWNHGYDYKNSISQACFFNLAARLALYTGNHSYAEWADKTWDWMEKTNLIDPDKYWIYDGTHTGNCSEITPYQWTYNAGAFLLGAGAMFNYTTGRTREIWRTRLDGLLNGTMVFFTGRNNDIMTEVACEPVDLCDLDEQSFKAYLSRWMAATIKWAPWSSSRILPYLRSTARAAVSTCKGGDSGRMCGLKWTQPGKFDGNTGIGQQMAVMEVVLGNMIHSSGDPLTDNTGGTSVGDSAAGGEDVGRLNPFTILDDGPPISSADRAGACVLTVAIIICLMYGCVFVLADEASKQTALQRFTGLFLGSRPDRYEGAEQRDERNHNAVVMDHKPRWSHPGLTNEGIVKVHHTATISPIQHTSPPPRPPPRRHRCRQETQTQVPSYWDSKNTNGTKGAAETQKKPSSANQARMARD